MVSCTPLLNIKFPDLGQFLLKWANLPANCKFGIFPENIFFTKGWTFVRDSSGINFGNFLDKGNRFWTRTLLAWHTTVPFVVLFPTTLRVMSVSIVQFFYRSKISLYHMVCCCSVKSLSERAFWQKEERYNSHQKKPKKILIAFLKEICLFLQNMFCFFGVLC